MITIRHQIEFHETDMAGIVHFSNYFKWMEAAETAFLKSHGIPLAKKNQEIVTGWPKISTTCNFTAPLYFQDIIEIELSLQEIRNSSLSYYFEFFKLKNNTRTQVASGQMTTVHAKFNILKEIMAAALIEDDLRERLQNSL